MLLKAVRLKKCKINLSVLILSQWNLLLNDLWLKKVDVDVSRYFLVFHSIPDRYKTQEMCGSVVSEDPF